jgi:hypothetical protein
MVNMVIAKPSITPQIPGAMPPGEGVRRPSANNANNCATSQLALRADVAAKVVLDSYSESL